MENSYLQMTLLCLTRPCWQVVKREDLEFEGAILRLEKKIDYMERKKEERQGAAAFSNGQVL